MDGSDTNNDNVNLEDTTDDHGNLTVARDPSDNASIKSDFEADQKNWMATTARQLSLHVDMYVLADKYDIASLSDLAKKKFEQKAKATMYGPYFTESPVLDLVSRIYAVTGEHTRGLRDVVVEYTRLQRTKIDSGRDMNATDVTNPWTSQVQSLFESVPDFSADISRSWLETPYLGYCKVMDCWQILREQEIACPSCGHREGLHRPGTHFPDVRTWSTGE